MLFLVILRLVSTFKGEYQMRGRAVDWGLAIEETEKTGDGGDLNRKKGTTISWRYGILFIVL